MGVSYSWVTMMIQLQMWLLLWFLWRKKAFLRV